MALALDRIAFLELLLNYGASVQSILNQNLLEFLYGYVALAHTSGSTMKYKKNDYCSLIEKEKVSELLVFTEHEGDKVCIKLDVIQKNINKFCKCLIKERDVIYSKVNLSIIKFFIFYYLRNCFLHSIYWSCLCIFRKSYLQFSLLVQTLSI